jgi:DNA polymerase-2
VTATRGAVSSTSQPRQSSADVISPGGYVMNSRPGIYDNVLVLDFKSLYPSIIRTFLIDPCGFWLAQHRQLPEADVVPGFNGAIFVREGHILPQIIEHLWQARDRAKAEEAGRKWLGTK